MNRLKTVVGIIWRSVVVAIAYFAGLMLAGMLGALVGWHASASSSASTSTSRLVMLASVLWLGIFLGPVARRLKITR